MTPPISEADIQRLVRAFYTQVQQDDILAPIFNTRIQADAWDAHMDHIADFWSSVILQTQRFSGNPMAKHAALNGLTPAHFAHWLALFRETADKVLIPEHAQAIHSMAERIGQSLQMGLAFHHEKAGQTDHPFTEFSVRKPR